ncbi:MAG: phosphotriesterase-related protein [Actinomycetota bacterium]|nr:phosphotriesterase-related protein [Actinomycetota bacterium]
MSKVQTVKGPVEADQLGFTLMHEHVFVLSTEIEENYKTGFGEEEARIEQAVDRLNELAAAGVKTFVDLTVIGLGRDIKRVQRVAERVDLNIVVATGLYTYNELPFYFLYRGPGTLLGGEEPLVDMFVGDIEQGIAGTGVKAGILKCATEHQGITPDVERVLRAVAQAHRRTGVPISTHSFAPGRNGLDQQRVFSEEGVDLSRVVIGHSGDTTDIGYLREIADAGSYLGMDRFGIDILLPFEQRVDTVAEMCRLGYANKMVLSHDAACHNDWFDDAALEVATPNWHFMHILRDVIPALRERGVTEEQIRQMTEENPTKIFSERSPY